MTVSSRPLPALPREADQPVTMTWTEAVEWFARHRVEVEAAYRHPRARAWVFIVRPSTTDTRGDPLED